MKIYVIRHGESETNLRNCWCGWTDVSLTDKGRKDAENAGEFLKDITFDKVYSSDLKRAMETAGIVLRDSSPIETSPLIREFNVGNLAGQPISILTDEQRLDTAVNGYAAFGGESQAEFTERITTFMRLLESLDCDTVAVFSHAGVLRGMLDTILQFYVPRRNVLCRNCAIAVFEYTNETWSLHSWINLN